MTSEDTGAGATDRGSVTNPPPTVAPAVPQPAPERRGHSTATVIGAGVGGLVVGTLASAVTSLFLWAFAVEPPPPPPGPMGPAAAPMGPMSWQHQGPPPGFGGPPGFRFGPPPGAPAPGQPPSAGAPGPPSPASTPGPATSAPRP
ncbi:hypothetical protein [Mycobacterium kubicae]|uniref:hypothetical protein n=1 Tax=Mycobacterium kubicae TaxID=120959 RepID=UPI0009ED2063|nr:hypothetical protein [Mycobacterium kubicae]